MPAMEKRRREKEEFGFRGWLVKVRKREGTRKACLHKKGLVIKLRGFF